MADPHAHLPPLLRAAAKRLPRRARTPAGEGGSPVPQNNYLAEAPKNPVGARPGNRNAVIQGLHTVDSRARRAAIKSLCRRAAILSDAVAAMRQLGLNPQDHAALLALLAERHDG